VSNKSTAGCGWTNVSALGGSAFFAFHSDSAAGKHLLMPGSSVQDYGVLSYSAQHVALISMTVGRRPPVGVSGPELQRP